METSESGLAATKRRQRLGELVTGAEVGYDVLGRDRWGRGLAVCFADDVALNREMVRQGWALAYYPERGAVPGPTYDAEQLEAEQARRGFHGI